MEGSQNRLQTSMSGLRIGNGQGQVLKGLEGQTDGVMEFRWEPVKGLGWRKGPEPFGCLSYSRHWNLCSRSSFIYFGP